MPDHYEGANSPPDSLLLLRLTSVRAGHSFLIGSNAPALTPVISHLLPGKSQDHKSPLRVIRQVSHCGKPQCTAAPEKPLGFSASAKLASGLCPLGTPSKVYSTSAHRSPPSVRLRVHPCIPPKVLHPLGTLLYITYCASDVMRIITHRVSPYVYIKNEKESEQNA